MRDMPKIISVDDHVISRRTCGSAGCRLSTATWRRD